MSAFFRKPGYLNRTSAAALLAAADADLMDRPNTAVHRDRDVSVSLDERPRATVATSIIANLEDDKLYSTKELGKVLAGFIGHRSLERYRCATGKGGGPAYCRSGGGAFARGKIAYLGSDVKSWLRRSYVESWHDPEAVDRERERRHKRDAKNNRR
jgi:hypothetical protein